MEHGSNFIIPHKSSEKSLLFIFLYMSLTSWHLIVFDRSKPQQALQKKIIEERELSERFIQGDLFLTSTQGEF
jgi:hypothetical protein